MRSGGGFGSVLRGGTCRNAMGIGSRSTSYFAAGSVRACGPGLSRRAWADQAGLIDWQVSVDSTISRAHQHAAGARRRCSPPARRAGRTTRRRTGRSRAGTVPWWAHHEDPPGLRTTLQQRCETELHTITRTDSAQQPVRTLKLSLRHVIPLRGSPLVSASTSAGTTRSACARLPTG